MTTRIALVIAALLFWTAAVVAQQTGQQQRQQQRPDVILILVDDMGWGELGAYGQKKIQTPNLDRIAKEGILFTDGYAGSSLCAPSRSCLLTGLHTGHTPIRHNPAQARGWNRDEQGDPPLPRDAPSLGKIFKQAGYDTAIIGKWGLGRPTSPAEQGFDYFFGYDSHIAAHNYYPSHLWRNAEKVPLDGKTYSHDLIAEEALRYVKERRAAKRPYLLYLAFTIPHQPFNPPSVDPYADEDWPDGEKRQAATITRMDADIGKLLALVEELGADSNTLILFTSDNGSDSTGGHKVAFSQSNGPFRGEKGQPYEGGIRVPLIARWPAKIAPGTRSDVPVGGWDVLPTLAEAIGAPVPEKLDGVSLLPTMFGEPEQQKRRDYLYWELAVADGFQQVRMDNWKAVRRHVSDGQTPTVELYDLSSDPSESRDVAAQHPEIVARVEKIVREARTPSRMFPLTHEEMQSAPPKAKLQRKKQAGKQ